MPYHYLLMAFHVINYIKTILQKLATTLKHSPLSLKRFLFKKIISIYKINKHIIRYLC